MLGTYPLRRRERSLLTTLLALVTLLVGAVAWTTPASASSAPIAIEFVKQSIGAGKYVGTTSDGGSIEMQVSNSSVTGNMQHFSVTIWATVEGRSFTAELDGTFNFSTAKTLLNGAVTEGWLAGARAHERGQLVGFDPLTFTGTLWLLPGSAEGA
jgi:uncharacterized membrane protein YoaK (UPF0700 family)